MSEVSPRLLRSSARMSYDPEVDLDWDAPLVDGLWFMQPERLSLYGTALWDAMSHEQRLELSKHEVASIASVGVWFEIVLMQLMARELYSAARAHGKGRLDYTGIVTLLEEAAGVEVRGRPADRT